MIQVMADEDRPSKLFALKFIYTRAVMRTPETGMADKMTIPPALTDSPGRYAWGTLLMVRLAACKAVT